jgi:cytidine deaminase
MVKESLIAAAIQARERAYVPYSGYKVGAALLCKSEKIYTGCNVENASYGASICAERTAAVKAVSEGEQEFVAMAVVADGPVPGSPCGICRQFLYEFNPKLDLILADLRGNIIETTLERYLPEAFGAKHLSRE